MGVLAIAAAAFAALAADDAPTDIASIDVALRAGFAAGVTFAAARARPWSWIAAAGIVVVGASASAVPFVIALAVYAAAVLAVLRDERSPVVGAAVGAGVVLLALWLPVRGPTGTTAGLALLATGVLVASGCAQVEPASQRRLVWAAAIAGGLVVVVGAMFATSLLLARADAEAGAGEARAGVAAAREGRTRRAIRHFEEAERRLRAASSMLERPWSRAARVLPVVGQHERAIRRLVATARDLAATGAFAAREADVDRLRAVGGRIDPEALVALRAPLAVVQEALARTRRDLSTIDSPWLVPLVADEVAELRATLRDAAHDARTAVLAAEVGPVLLGADSPTRFFVMFTTPTEARASGGGFLGNYGVLTLDDGRLSLTEFGRNTDLNLGGDPAARTITGFSEYLRRYGPFEPTREWRNVNLAPDFPTVASVVGELFPQSGGEPVDGVIAVNPRGLARVLRITGPVDVEGLDEPLSADNAARILMRDQYGQFRAVDARTDFLEAAAAAVTERLTVSSLPGPRAVGQVLARAVERGDLRVVAFDPRAAMLFDRLGTSGRFGGWPGDALGLVTQNASGNKIDLFLHRALEVDTTLDIARGEQRTRAMIRLRNDAPTTGYPGYVIGNVLDLPVGTNRTMVSLYTPLRLAAATLDGESIGVTGDREGDLNVYTRFVNIPPGTEVVLTLDLIGPMRVVGPRDEPRYRLDLWHQTTVHADRVRVRVRAAEGYRLSEPSRRFHIVAGTARFADRGRASEVSLDARVRT